MLKTVIHLAIILLIAAGLKNSAESVETNNDRRCGLKSKKWALYTRTYTHTIIPVSSSDEKSNEGSQSKEYEELEAELKRLMEEMRRLGEKGKEKIRKDILPLIRREIERLRKKLEELRRKDEEPVEVHVNPLSQLGFPRLPVEPVCPLTKKPPTMPSLVRRLGPELAAGLPSGLPSAVTLGRTEPQGRRQPSGLGGRA